MSLCINPQCQESHNSDTLLFCKGCGSELLIDGRYRTQSLLGQGGFGQTYEVLDFHSRPKVLKVLTDNNPKYVELFRQEARVLEMMNHPGVPQLDIDGYFTYYPQDREEPLYCIVMEKIEGLNLEEYLAKRGNKPIFHKRALRWLAELSIILERVHNLDFFHRDIKPSNIMLKANGCLVLIDFGSAREVSHSYIQKQSAGQVTGVVSCGYTPTEQIRGRATKQSDFYALGSTIVFLLTGANPLEFYNSQEDKIEWSDAVENIPPDFVRLIDSMLSSLPINRPQNAKDIFQEIVKIDPSLQSVENYWEKSSNIPLERGNRGDTSTVYENKDDFKTNSSSEKSARLEREMSAEFIDRARKELVEFIGPMGSIICNRTLADNPNLSTREFIRALANKISNDRDAKTFENNLL